MDLLFALGTPSTPAADAASIVSESIVAARANPDEPTARSIETTIALPVQLDTVRDHIDPW